MGTYINIGNRYIYNKEDGTTTDLLTGCIYKNKEEIKKLTETTYEENKSIQILMEIYDIPQDNSPYYYNWKNKSWFIKIYRTEMREYLKKAKLSSNAGLLLSHIQLYIEYGTNRIVNKDNKTFTNKELQKLTGLNKKNLNKALNELEKKLFIARKGKTKSREIYFNPYLICAGNEVEKDTIKLFKLAGYKPITSY